MDDAAAFYEWLRSASHDEVHEVALRSEVPVLSAIQLIALHATLEQWLDLMIHQRAIAIVVPAPLRDAFEACGLATRQF